MPDETIVAVYDTAAHASDAAQALRTAGVPESAIDIHAGAAGTSVTSSTTSDTRGGGFWSSLFGGDSGHDSTVYDRSLEGGSTVVTVKAPDAHVNKVMEILESYHPIDIDERATGYGLTQSTYATPVTAPVTPVAAGVTTGRDQTLSLSEETLVVGKRLMNRGGTRIRRYVVETPVEENVSLHSERVVLDRHAVTDARPVSDAAFTDKTIEMTETAEEAVVGKTAHVYEEVGLRKEGVDRTETVHETVRREEVEVEQIPASDTTTTNGKVLPKI